MGELIKLELRKNNFKKYVLYSVIIAVALFCLQYYFAYISGTEATLSSYKQITAIVSSLFMFSFSILASVIYGKVVLDDFVGKRAILLFTYPVKKNKLFYSKLILIMLFIVITMTVFQAIVFTVFFMTETSMSMVNDTLSISTIMFTAKTSVIFIIMTIALGLISMCIGFITKTVPSIIVSAVLLSTIISNVTGRLAGNFPVYIILTVVISVISIIMSVICGQRLKNIDIDYLI